MGLFCGILRQKVSKFYLFCGKLRDLDGIDILKVSKSYLLEQLHA